MLVQLKNENEFNELIKSEKKILVDFYASWCRPCLMLSPILEELAKTTDYTIVKLNVDQHRDLAMKYHVSSIPTLITFQKGEIVARKMGFINKNELINLLK